MALLATQTISQTGIVPTKNAVSASDTFTNDGKTFLHVVNGNGSTLTVTVVSSGTQDGLAISDQTYTLATTTEKVMGPFTTNTFGTTTTVTFDLTTSVTCQVYTMNAVR